MTAVDIPHNGKRSPEVLATWIRDGLEHRLVRAHSTNEWRADKRKPGSKHWSAYYWTKTPRQLQAFKEENGL